MTDGKTIMASQRAASEALQKAQSTLSDLVREKHAAAGRQRVVDAERRKMAFSGIAGGSASDQKKLADITSESVRLTLELDNFAHAISEAEDHVTAARQAVERAQLRVNAEIARSCKDGRRRRSDGCGPP